MKLFLMTVAAMFVLIGCAVNGKILDYAATETSLKKIKLTEYPFLKFYCGGAARECSLDKIATVSIDPLYSLVYNNELWLSSMVAFKDGTVLPGNSANKSSIEEDTHCYISIRNVLQGNFQGGALRIPLDKVIKLTIEE